MKEAGIVALSEDGKSVMDSSLFRKSLKEAARLNLPMFSHCEDKALVEGGVMNAGKKAEELGLPGITNSVEDVIVAKLHHHVKKEAETGFISVIVQQRTVWFWLRWQKNRDFL